MPIPEEMALVVLVEGAGAEQRGASFYLDGATCLNQIARIARFLPPALALAMFYEHTECKWSGRGMAPALEEPAKSEKVSRKAKGEKRGR